MSMIFAHNFGALGDNSGALVREWLPGGQHPLSGVSSMEDLRNKTGVLDLQDTDTIDWAAIMWARQEAANRPIFLDSGRYRISRPLVFPQGGLLGEVAAPGTQTHNVIITRASGVASCDIVRLEPPGSNRHFHFENLVLQGGLRNIYGQGPWSLAQSSLFESLILNGAAQDGLFFDGLQAIGCQFRRMRAENNRSHGFRWTGNHLLNGTLIQSCRAVLNWGHGFVFDNIHPQASTPGLTIVNTIAEYNNGSGMIIKGYQGVSLLGTYFEANDNDATGNPDLVLNSSSTTSPSVHASVVAIAPVFTGPKQPDKVRISGTPPYKQSLVLIGPKVDGFVRDDNLSLTVVPVGGVKVV